MSEEIQDNVSEAEDIQEIPLSDALDIENNPPEIQENEATLPEIPPVIDAPPALELGGDATPKPKRRGRPTGARNKPKIVAVPVEPEYVELAEVEELAPPPPQAKARAKPNARQAKVHFEVPQPQVHQPPWAQHATAASYLEEQLRELKRQQQTARHEMWAHLVRQHI